jgi:hypothetical protein
MFWLEFPIFGVDLRGTWGKWPQKCRAVTERPQKGTNLRDYSFLKQFACIYTTSRLGCKHTWETGWIVNKKRDHDISLIWAGAILRPTALERPQEPNRFCEVSSRSIRSIGVYGNGNVHVPIEANDPYNIAKRYTRWHVISSVYQNCWKLSEIQWIRTPCLLLRSASLRHLLKRVRIPRSSFTTVDGLLV